MKRSGAVLATTAILATGGIGFATQIGPDVSDYESFRTREADSAARGLTVTFMGVSTLLFDDGDSAIMTDGFFTRPGRLSLARFRPDSARIMQALNRGRVERLAAVIPLHSHYDHVMDAPYVARWKGAKLVGSSSTSKVGLGALLPEERITVAVKGKPMTFGRFSVTLYESRHVPTGIILFPGPIKSPLKPPASAGLPPR
jgi:L-ascorbate metabolism protein UlaG (beta-lactamase superfamily)